MPVQDLEACITFASVNRTIADRFAEKARHLLELVQSVDDLDERIRISDLIQFTEIRAAAHASVAQRQERDLGVTCHCNDAALDILHNDVDTTGNRHVPHAALNLAL